MVLRKALLLAAAVVVFALLGSCDVLKQNIATTGPKRYKVLITQNLENVRREIDQDGQVKDSSVEELEKILKDYEGEMGKFGSYAAGKKALEHLKTGQADEGKRFHEYQEAKFEIDKVLDALQTEVQ